ncbi:Hemolysin-type calcium-binding region [Arcticibacter svalbardensis MN12-7]|uniref:Hemolysin-type calcium-binding region n=1 Tax=Arcticibacter svalbardensis MN12-7 TaxID=1150600 RepID=R9GQN4_9SPHI|nr:DUF3344 domain-containing protein [Arcticibacter svalbardensis]EOR93855.1 Hemolysin-type calcium-binding region [Arcticibacter svalbardensis MN12-7]
MKTRQITKQLTILIFSGLLIFGCKKTKDANSVDSVSSVEKKIKLANGYGTKSGCVDCEIKNRTQSKAQINADNGPIHYFNTFYNTDYLSVGVGGLRDVGNGQIRVTGTFPLVNVTKAYLYWNGLSNSTEVDKPIWTSKVTFNSTGVVGTPIGISSSNCWPYYQSQSHRADVTNIVKSASSRTFTFNAQPLSDLNPNGASLILFYSDGNSSNNRDIILFEGNDALTYFPGYPRIPNAPVDATGWNFTLSGINYTSGKVMMSLHVADGQPAEDGPLVINGIGLPGAQVTSHLFDGKSVPGGLYWDVVPIDITPSLSRGISYINVASSDFEDCYSLVVAAFNFPRGVVLPPSPIKVNFDYRPLRCPNTLLASSTGAEEAAILGTSTFDINQVDLSSVKLNGISFKKSRIIDKTAPYAGTVTDCSTCSTLPPDGSKDLEFLFDNQQLLKTLGTVQNKQCIKVTLTGKLLPLYGSIPFVGEDYIIISK